MTFSSWVNLLPNYRFLGCANPSTRFWVCNSIIQYHSKIYSSHFGEPKLLHSQSFPVVAGYPPVIKHDNGKYTICR